MHKSGREGEREKRCDTDILSATQQNSYRGHDQKNDRQGSDKAGAVWYYWLQNVTQSSHFSGTQEEHLVLVRLGHADKKAIAHQGPCLCTYSRQAANLSELPGNTSYRDVELTLSLFPELSLSQKLLIRQATDCVKRIGRISYKIVGGEVLFPPEW
ncbi:hypothetical protein Tco_1409158 [Tanacetum coccineum]